MTEDQIKTKQYQRYQRYASASDAAAQQRAAYETLMSAYSDVPIPCPDEIFLKRERRRNQHTVFMKKAEAIKAKITEPLPFMLSDIDTDTTYSVHVFSIGRGKWELTQRLLTLEQAQAFKRNLVVVLNFPSTFVEIESIRRVRTIVSYVVDLEGGPA